MIGGASHKPLPPTGSRIVVAARNAEALDDLVREIAEHGAQTLVLIDLDAAANNVAGLLNEVRIHLVAALMGAGTRLCSMELRHPTFRDPTLLTGGPHVQSSRIHVHVSRRVHRR